MIEKSIRILVRVVGLGPALYFVFIQLSEFGRFPYVPDRIVG